MNIAANAVEIDDGIANDLAGTMVSDVAAAIGFVEFNTFLAKDVFVGQKIGAIAVAAESDDVGMRTEKKDIVDGVEFARSDNALLHDEGVGVRDQAEVDGE